MDKLFVVTLQGYQGWGVEYFLVGVYDTREKANEVIAQSGYPDYYFEVNKIDFNKTYEIKQESQGDLYTDIFIGRYIEE